jgi:tRNA (guanine26-N2/guanine27-N2)-dimethyltransferase
MEQLISEGKARISAFIEDKVSRRLPVFYNPVMRLNRDVSVLLLNSLGKKGLQIADPLAGSGIRAIRFLLELKKGIVKSLSLNDLSENAARNISQNLRLNKLRPGKDLTLSNEDANLFLLKSTGFDYIDIDPFGSPCPFLDSAILRLSRQGILAVTATDTAALAGSSKAACIRKYWAVPLRNEMMHEIGIRILIRRVQLIGAEHEKALTPIFSYTDEHYYRVFFRCDKGKQKVDGMMRLHKFLIYDNKTMETRLAEGIFNSDNSSRDRAFAGPIWTGPLWDRSLVQKMLENCDQNKQKLRSLLSMIGEESQIEAVGFYDLHRLARAAGKDIPPIEKVLKKGLISRTHFLGWGIRSKEPPRKIINTL